MLRIDQAMKMQQKVQASENTGAGSRVPASMRRSSV